jgi:four helix bundle protein
LKIAEGASRKSEIERKRFFEIARGSVVEVDAVLDIANDLGYIKKNIDSIGVLLIKCFKILSALIITKPH